MGLQNFQKIYVEDYLSNFINNGYVNYIFFSRHKYLFGEYIQIILFSYSHQEIGKAIVSMEYFLKTIKQNNYLVVLGKLGGDVTAVSITIWIDGCKSFLQMIRKVMFTRFQSLALNFILEWGTIL